jgi:dTDP-4-amino-4,6-dideoxygalactose transaminase
MNVPLLDLRPTYAPIQNEIEAAVLKALRETKYILGPEVSDLESDLQRYTGAKHVVTCASGSDALLLSLMALGIKTGDEIITSPFTFFATASAMTRLGAKPVFVDIDPRTFNIDPSRIDATITPRTKAIMPVHLFGQCAEMDPILKLASHHKIAVVEDAAQAIGATYKGRQSGTMGVMGALSFFPTKNLGGAGDGGALATNDDALAETLRVLRVHGAKPKYYHHVVGINSRLDTIQAAILRVKLKHLDQWTKQRRQNAERYNARFHKLGAASAISLPSGHPDCVHTYNQYTIRSPRRDSLRDHLQTNGIGTEIYYPIPLHLQKCFAFLGHHAGDFPNAERAAAESLSLPIYPGLTDEAIDYVADTVAAFVRSNA